MGTKNEYIDFYERALYNHILASQDPDTGMKTYFVSTQPGHFKVYCSAENSFWCCTGTGMENPARYTRGIYYHHDNNLFVNLFIASTFKASHLPIAIKQETEFPKSSQSVLTIEETSNEEWNLHIRVPYWIKEEMRVYVNNQEEEARSATPGFISLKRKWKKGDKITLHLPMGLHSYVAKDDQRKIGIMYGPLVLAGALGREQFPDSDILDNHLSLNNHPLIDVPTLVTDPKDLLNKISLVDHNTLTFEAEKIGQPGNQSVKLIPFYQLHHERYTLYWDVMDEHTYEHFVDEENIALQKLRERTVDEVQPNEQQPEVEHNLLKSNSNSGYLNVIQRGWRDCYNGGYFSYQLKVLENEPMALRVMYFEGGTGVHVDGSWYKRQFSIEVDGEVIVEPEFTKGIEDEETYIEEYPIPLALTEGKQSVEVKFVTKEDHASGRIYEVRMVKI
ncbi:DUF6805 domain-containing protein [Bacillus sp. JCM 19034]|uniref:DUF6805 domain-containing protein n=1 Tax=Bacillus sp. JCM 19034 TaxID=1481928 RepID=UPI000A713EAA